jgi:hypothetical protein
MTTSSSQKLGPAPPADSPIGEFRRYLERAYGLPDGYVVERVIRHGGRATTALTVHIRPPGGGKELVIRYDEERHCRSAEALRGQAAADTDGLTRSDLIIGKTAMSVYEALCALADTYSKMDVKALTWEWVQQLVASSEVITGLGLGRDRRYDALKALKDHRYSKELVQTPNVPAVPVVLIDADDDGARYVTARHLAVFVRFQLGVDVLSDDNLMSRMVEIGGQRRQLEQWNVDRTHKVRLVLYRLPEDDPDEPDVSDE